MDRNLNRWPQHDLVISNPWLFDGEGDGPGDEAAGIACCRSTENRWSADANYRLTVQSPCAGSMVVLRYAHFMTKTSEDRPRELGTACRRAAG